MGSTKFIAKLDGNNTQEIEGLDNLAIKASFISDTRNSETVQPVVDISSISLLGGAAKQVTDYIQDGIDGNGAGILESMPFGLDITDGVISDNVLDGLLDFDKYEKIHSAMVNCGVKERQGLNSFDKITKNTYFNLLEAEGVFNVFDYVDAKYIVEKIDIQGEASNLSLTLFTISVTLIQQFQTLQKDLALVLALAAALPAGPVSAVIYAATSFAINLAIFILLINEMVKLAINLAGILVPPVRRHKCIFQSHLFEKTFTHLGYSFETNIPEMENVAILPGNTTGIANNPSGMPKLGQSGETLAKQISHALIAYDAKLAVIDNVVHIRSVNDPFWIKNSGYTMPNTGDDNPDALNLQSEKVIYDMFDFKSNRRVSFAPDNSDEQLAANGKGTSFMAITKPVIVNDQANLNFGGIDDQDIPVSLAVRKDQLSNIETEMGIILSIIDSLRNLFGGNSNLGALVTDRIGAMRISQTVFNNPKWLWLEEKNGELNIPQDHRDKLAAKPLYVSYHARKSIVNTTPVLKQSNITPSSINYTDSAQPDYGNQNRFFENFRVKFDFGDYLLLKKNSYFATPNGKTGKVEKAEWINGQNKATLTFRIPEIYTKNVIEIFIEPKSTAA